MARDRFVRNANLMSGLTIVSRFAGLARDKICSYYLGVGWQWSAFWMGFQFPNLFRRIFGEGALTAVFVPAYTEVLHKEGKEAAGRLASATATLLILVLSGITIVGEAVLIPLALSSSVQMENRLAAAMIALMLPYCVMVCLVALLGALATVHDRFTAQALSPIILNISMAVAAGLAGWWASHGLPLEKRVFWVAVSVLIAGILQVLQMMPTIWASGVHLRPLTAFRQAGIGRVIKPMLPILVGYSAVQINTFMDTQIAWWLSPDGHGGRDVFMVLGHAVHVAMQEGAVGKLSIAQRIYMLPVGIFGVSMAMAVFPPMAKAAAANDTPELKRLLVTGLKRTLFLSIPSSLGMILVAHSLITLVYLGGKHVTLTDVDRAYKAAVFFCLGIFAFEAQMVILRVFYVLKDTKTPTKVAMWMIGLNFALNLTLVWFLQEGGIGLATTLAAIAQGSILLLILRKRLGTLGLKSLLVNIGKSLLAATVMVMIGWLVLQIPMPWTSDAAAATQVEGYRRRAEFLKALVQVPMLVVACGSVYLWIAWFLEMPEVQGVPVLGRLFPAKNRGADH